MKMYRARSGMAATLLLGTTLLLSACGGGDSSGGGSVTGSSACPAGTTVCGTAATGAPMASASVVLHCKNNWNEGTSTDANGVWKYNVPATNLPCAVKVTNGTDTYYAFTLGTGSNIITNLSPFTSLALAQALGAAPDDVWFNSVNPAGNSAQLDAMTAALPAAIAALNTALASYALPAGFNPLTSVLTAASGSQTGNAHDHLLEQFKAALNGGDFASLLASFASYETGDASPLPAPSYTSGASTRTAFFEAFAGDYTLKVTNSGAEGSNNTAAKNLFPQDRAITVHMKPNGDVVIDAVGRSITWSASTYNGSVGVGKWAEFDGTASTLNTVRYRNGTTLDLYITYDPDTGKLQVDPQGFINNEGYASLKGAIFVPPPAPVATTCSTGDDKLVFTNGPTDFCGFTRSASTTNNVSRYYQFTSAAGSHGVTYVKFDMNSDDSAVEKVTIENDSYAFICGLASACSGVTVTTNSGYKQFTLNNTALAVLNGASQPITVNGLLMHPVSTTGGSLTPPALASNETGVRFLTTGLVGMIGTTTGTMNTALERFFSNDPALTSDGSRFTGGQVFPAGGVSNGAIALKNAQGQPFPTTPGTYACGAGPTALSLQVNYSSNQQYISSNEAGFDCSITITRSTVTGTTNPVGQIEGTFTAHLARFGVTPPTLASGVEVSGSFRLGTEPEGSTTPATKAGQLAAYIGARFAGTYNLTCNSTAHTVTVNTDGSATLDSSTPLANTTNAGSVEVTTANTITGKYTLHYTNTSNGAQAHLGFIGNATDTVTGASSILPAGEGSAQGCTFVSGPTTNSFDRLTALKTLAPLSANLSCTGSDQATRNELADGTQTLNLSADGSLTLGSSVSATTTKTSLSSLQVLFGGSFASSSYGSVWYEPSFYSGASVGASNRNLDVRLAGDGSTAKSVRFNGGGLNSLCVAAN